MSGSIRVGDRIRTQTGTAPAIVESAGEDGCLRVRYDAPDGKYPTSRWKTLDDGEAILLCHSCEQDAVTFTPAGRPLCVGCSECFMGATLDVRPDVPPALVSCICGESLDVARVNGVWSIGDIVCEYRTCLHCESTRAYMPRDRTSKFVALVDTDDRMLPPDDRFASLLHALERDPFEGAQLTRGDVVLADTIVTPTGPAWRILPPQREQD